MRTFRINLNNMMKVKKNWDKMHSCNYGIMTLEKSALSPDGGVTSMRSYHSISYGTNLFFWKYQSVVMINPWFLWAEAHLWDATLEMWWDADLWALETQAITIPWPSDLQSVQVLNYGFLPWCWVHKGVGTDPPPVKMWVNQSKEIFQYICLFHWSTTYVRFD